MLAFRFAGYSNAPEPMSGKRAMRNAQCRDPKKSADHVRRPNGGNVPHSGRSTLDQTHQRGLPDRGGREAPSPMGEGRARPVPGTGQLGGDWADGFAGFVAGGGGLKPALRSAGVVRSLQSSASIISDRCAMRSFISSRSSFSSCLRSWLVADLRLLSARIASSSAMARPRIGEMS